MAKIAILIPCYNEATTIAKVVRDWQSALPDASIFVFDNNSKDATADEALRSGASVIPEYRQGKGNVVRAMFRKIDADIYVMVDGDDTYPPTNINELIKPVEDGRADMVIGDRLSSTYFTENQRAFHNSGNRFVRWTINKLFGANLHDILTGYRVFSREFVKSMPVMSKGFEIETELTIYALSQNFKVEEIPVPYRDRPEDSSSKLNTVTDGIRIIKTLLSLFRDYRPFTFFSCLAVLVSIIGLIFLVPVFAEYFATGLVERFPTLIFGCFLMLGSLLLFCCGLILQVQTNQTLKVFEVIRGISK